MIKRKDIEEVLEALLSLSTEKKLLLQRALDISSISKEEIEEITEEIEEIKIREEFKMLSTEAIIEQERREYIEGSWAESQKIYFHEWIKPKLRAILERGFPYYLENKDLLSILEDKDFSLRIFRLARDELFKRATNPTDYPLTNEELIKLLRWVKPQQRKKIIEVLLNRSVEKRLLEKSLKYIEDIKDLQELEKEIKKILRS